MWIIVEKATLHSIWRASQGAWLGFPVNAPAQVKILVEDLLDLSLHNYAAVRT